jgi:hypothetical protein
MPGGRFYAPQRRVLDTESNYAIMATWSRTFRANVSYGTRQPNHPRCPFVVQRSKHGLSYSTAKLAGFRPASAYYEE